MSISDGQPVNAAVTNPAFISKNIDDAMPNKLDFTNNDPASGPQFHNVQRNVNSLMSFLGMVVDQVYNLLPSWATTNRGSSGDNIFQRVGAIDTAFDPTTGHEHTGVPGDAPQISALTLSNIPLIGIGVQGVDIAAVTGTSSNVTTQFSGYSPSTNTGTQGAVVNAPYNKIIIRNSATDSEYFDTSGNIVYGRLTFSSGTWTLSYYSEVTGVETAYNFVSSSGIRFYFQLLTPVISASGPVYSDLFFVPSSNATADIINATTTLKGKVQLATTTQSVGSSNSAGTANASVANEDHSHQGVHSVAKSGGSQLFGDITFTPGTNITIVEAGNDLTINSTAAGGGGGSLQWIESANAPIASVDSVGNRIYSFQSGLGQNLYAAIKIPHSYAGGTQIQMYLQFYDPDNTGTALLSTTTTLIRPGTDAITSTTNQHVSTNTAVTLGSGTVNKPQTIILDLTDATGDVNGIAVAADNILLIKLTRGSDTATSDIKALVYCAEITTQ